MERFLSHWRPLPGARPKRAKHWAQWGHDPTRYSIGPATTKPQKQVAAKIGSDHAQDRQKAFSLFQPICKESNRAYTPTPCAHPLCDKHKYKGAFPTCNPLPPLQLVSTLKTPPAHAYDLVLGCTQEGGGEGEGARGAPPPPPCTSNTSNISVQAARNRIPDELIPGATRPLRWFPHLSTAPMHACKPKSDCAKGGGGGNGLAMSRAG